MGWSAEETPTPRYHMVLGRAAEAARVMGSPRMEAEHLFLAIIRDRQTVPAQSLACLVDLDRVEAAMLYPVHSPPIALNSEPSSAAELEAPRVARSMGHSYVAVEHLFLAIIRDRQTVPAQSLARLIDLDRLESAILDDMNSPGYRGVPDLADTDRVFLPEGRELDEPLRNAIVACLPEGSSCGFNWEGDRPWIRVTGPGKSVDILNRALARLGRPVVS